jgi:hypothetical protein
VKLAVVGVAGVVSCNLNGDLVYELKKATVAENIYPFSSHALGS